MVYGGFYGFLMGMNMIFVSNRYHIWRKVYLLAWVLWKLWLAREILVYVPVENLRENPWILTWLASLRVARPYQHQGNFQAVVVCIMSDAQTRDCIMSRAQARDCIM